MDSVTLEAMVARARIDALLVRVEGMKAENLSRATAGLGLAHEAAFEDIACNIEREAGYLQSLKGA